MDTLIRMAAILRKLVFFFISYIFSGYILSSLHFLVEMFAIHFNNRAKLVTGKILPMIKTSGGLPLRASLFRP